MCTIIKKEELNSSNIEVIMSFGGAYGGFELAWAVHNDIEKEIGAGKVYLDAISLNGVSGTEYNWSSKFGIFKMSNPDWNKFYGEAMAASKCMIFFITEEWLKSFYCWHEYEMFKQQASRGGIQPFFILFPNATEYINRHSSIQVNNPDTSGPIKTSHYSQDLKLFHNDYTKKSELFIEVLSNETPGSVAVEGQTYSYDYRYTLNDGDMMKISTFINKYL